MTHNLDDTVALLSRTPLALNSLLRDLPETWTMRNEGENTWSAYDIVAHLIEAESNNWLVRANSILQHGESQTFAPFERVPKKEGQTLAQLLDEFARARAENLNKLRALNLTPADLDRRGRHPNFGTVTLSQLLATWAAHDLTHLHQLTRVMAHQYRETVGPWTVFLGVLKCEGHSDRA